MTAVKFEQQPNPKVIDITERQENQKKKYHQPLINETPDERDLQTNGADPITSREKIEAIVKEGISSGYLAAVALFVMGINTGFRAGDLLKARVLDVACNGKISDTYTTWEQKTGKPRRVYLNDSVKRILEYLIKEKKLKPESYLFCSEKCSANRSYVDDSVYKLTGNPDDIKTTKYPIADDGTMRQQAPMTVRNFSRTLERIAKKCGLDEHCSSHCMRQTYAYHFKRIRADNEEIPSFDVYDEQLLSSSLNHSSINTTQTYYDKVNKRNEYARQLKLNLGY